MGDMIGLAAGSVIGGMTNHGGVHVGSVAIAAPTVGVTIGIVLGTLVGGR
jgi:hypothetical protein